VSGGGLRECGFCRDGGLEIALKETFQCFVGGRIGERVGNMFGVC